MIIYSFALAAIPVLAVRLVHVLKSKIRSSSKATV